MPENSRKIKPKLVIDPEGRLVNIVLTQKGSKMNQPIEESTPNRRKFLTASLATLAYVVLDGLWNDPKEPLADTNGMTDREKQSHIVKLAAHDALRAVSGSLKAKLSRSQAPLGRQELKDAVTLIDARLEDAPDKQQAIGQITKLLNELEGICIRDIRKAQKLAPGYEGDITPKLIREAFQDVKEEINPHMTKEQLLEGRRGLGIEI